MLALITRPAPSIRRVDRSYPSANIKVALTGDYIADISHANYDVAPDGPHFLMLDPSRPEQSLAETLR